MVAARQIPHYISHLKHGPWQQSGPKLALMPPKFGIFSVLKETMPWHLELQENWQMIAGYESAFGMRVVVWGSDAFRDHM
jgi:D-3-phosphoglycerate dehydrogenase